LTTFAGSCVLISFWLFTRTTIASRMLRMKMSRGFAAGLSLALLALIVSARFASTTTEAAGPASLDELAKQSLARLDGELKVAGLKAPVEIVRDSRAFPTSTRGTTTTCSSRRAT